MFVNQQMQDVLNRNFGHSVETIQALIYDIQPLSPRIDFFKRGNNEARTTFDTNMKYGGVFRNSESFLVSGFSLDILGVMPPELLDNGCIEFDTCGSNYLTLAPLGCFYRYKRDNHPNNYIAHRMETPVLLATNSWFSVSLRINPRHVDAFISLPNTPPATRLRFEMSGTLYRPMN